ncbi:MAG: protoporphyrinogen/coproporphyrinogen oxidase, partial [Acidimicrobiales bacterium]
MGDIVVIGAGPAGLMVALMAAEAGHRVVVREATGDLGGMAGSFEVAGQRVDHGSHRLHPATEPDLMRRLVGLLGADLQTRERRGRIRLCGRWIGFPLRSLDMVRNLPPTFTAGVARDAVTGRFRSADGEGTFTSELTRRLGPTITDQFFAPYAEKLYGLPGTRLSVESADRRVSATSPAKIAGRVLRAARTRGRVFLYPRLGYGQIAERLADAAVAAGAELTFHTAVDTVTLASDHVTVAGPGHSGDADIVWSTMPLPDLSEALDPRPPVEVRAAITELRTRAMVLVYLVVPRPAYTAYDAHYFPDALMRTSRLSEPKNYRDGPDPRDRTVICAEIPCWRDDDLWNADAGALAELV